MLDVLIGLPTILVCRMGTIQLAGPSVRAWVTDLLAVTLCSRLAGCTHQNAWAKETQWVCYVQTQPTCLLLWMLLLQTTNAQSWCTVVFWLLLLCFHRCCCCYCVCCHCVCCCCCCYSCCHRCWCLLLRLLLLLLVVVLLSLSISVYGTLSIRLSIWLRKHACTACMYICRVLLGIRSLWSWWDLIQRNIQSLVVLE